MEADAPSDVHGFAREFKLPKPAKKIHIAEPPELRTPLLGGCYDMNLDEVLGSPSVPSVPSSMSSPIIDSEMSTSTTSTACSGDLEALAAIPAAASRPRRQFYASCFMFTSMWWTSAVVVIMTIKSTVHPTVFPYSFALTALTQPTTACFAYLLAKYVYRGKPPSPPMQGREKGQMLAYGLINGLEIGLTNKALQYLSVASRTMLSSMTILFMMTTAWLWGLERFGWRRAAACAFLMGGGMLQGLQREVTPQGFTVAYTAGALMQLISMLCSSQRWALAQFVLQRSPKDSGLGQMTKLQMLSITLPITGLVCIPFALFCEQDALAALPDQLMHGDLCIRVLLIASGLTAMLYAELKLVKQLSAVAFNVLSTVHQIPIVLVGVAFQHNHVGELSVCGFACCLAGALVYAWARQAERKPTAQK